MPCLRPCLHGDTGSHANSPRRRRPAGLGESIEEISRQLKFSDVRVDYNNYLLHLSIHFIDPKTNMEIASIPARPYYGNDWGFERYLKAALEEVSRKTRVEVTGETAEEEWPDGV